MQNIVTLAVYEDSGFQLMARINGQAGTAITQATISTIALKVFDISSTTSVATATPTPAANIYDTLQTTALDPRWTADETGYNFRYAVLASQVPDGGKKYLFEFKFTPTSGEAFHVRFETPTMDLYGS